MIFAIDVSGSMLGSKLALTKLALFDLIDAYDNISDNVSINIVSFAGGATDVGGGTYTNVSPGQGFSLEDAKTDIDALVAVGSTNYNAALTLGQSLFAPIVAAEPTTPGSLNTVYFLSDGSPNSGDTPAAWQPFVQSNNIVSFAIGLETLADDPELIEVAFPVGLNNPQAITDAADLADFLLSTVPEPFTAVGNVLDDSVLLSQEFGADGPGSPPLVSLELENFLFTFNAGVITATVPGTPNTALATADSFTAVGSVLTVVTELGGTLVFDFDGDTSTTGAGNGVGDGLPETCELHGHGRLSSGWWGSAFYVELTPVVEFRDRAVPRGSAREASNLLP